MGNSDIEGSISCEDIQNAFDVIDAVLENTPEWGRNQESVDDVVEFSNAMAQFENRYNKTLQKYYDLVERIEKRTERKGIYLHMSEEGHHVFEAYDATLRLLKDIPLVKSRWRKRERTF